ncbi:MAG: PAS domain-containing protein, partial [Deltaproteobacteria bacterium]|nr:PAS domain-containing protein [Deltaproteobacteria bacterium]
MHTHIFKEGDFLENFLYPGQNELWMRLLILGLIVYISLYSRKHIIKSIEVEESIIRAKEGLLQAQSIANIGSWDWDIETGKLEWSDEIYKIFGFEPRVFDATYEAFIKAVHPEDREFVTNSVEEAVHGGKPYDIEHRIASPGSIVRTVHEIGRVFYDDDNKPFRMIGTVQDITERKKSEELLRQTERRLTKAQEVGQVGTWAWNPKTGELVWSSEVYRILGFKPDEVVPSFELFLEKIHPDDREFVNKAVEEALNDNKQYNIDCRIIKKKGLECIANARGEVTFDEDGDAVQMLGTFQDITERKAMMDKLERLATTDALTKAFNKMKFEEIMVQEIERAERYGRPLSLFMFDADNFKEVNDTYGHLVGDEVLEALADIVRQSMRKSNYLVRWGGDEFVVICVEAELDDARLMAERVRKSVSEYTFEKAGNITLSFGVTTLKSGDDKISMVQRV